MEELTQSAHIPHQFRGLVPGRIVHYVLDGPRAGEIRPAIVVRVPDQSTGKVNLHVFADGTNDDVSRPGYWLPAVVYAEPEPGKNGRPGTWHWIPGAPTQPQRMG